jgi:uncharacterized protein YjhX (UPF0386 family)
VELDEPVLKVTEIEPRTPTEPPGDVSTGCYLDRPGEVLERLRLEHLNEEERKEIEKTCLEYQDIFHLPEETLGCTLVVKHKIRLEPGTELVNARPYRLSESQKQEVRRQVEELKEGGFITESNSAWNVPFLSSRKRRTQQVRSGGGWS